MIAGEVRGRIRIPQHLTIRTSGSVDAEVEAGRVTVQGRASGTIAASERVDVKQAAVVLAEVRSPSVVVEEGAVFSGTVRMELDLPEDL